MIYDVKWLYSICRIPQTLEKYHVSKPVKATEHMDPSIGMATFLKRLETRS